MTQMRYAPPTSLSILPTLGVSGTRGSLRNFTTRRAPISVPVPARGRLSFMTALSSTPKLDGNRVALRGRVFPDQWKRAHEGADAHGLSLSEYLGALVDRDHGLPNKIDNSQQEALPIAKAG